MLKKFFRFNVWMWALVALYGYLLRHHSYSPLPFIKKYAYWLHAHSHAAFLGWLHAGFAVLISFALFPVFSGNKKYVRLYYFMQAMVLAMLVSFPLQGYKAFSITFLSLFLLGTYVFAYFVFKKNENAVRFPATTKFARTAVIFMIISSLSPWMLGPVMVFLGKQSIWYNLDIYFYLHFQYNGWFFLSLVALTVYLFERKGTVFPPQLVNKSVWLLFNGIFWGYITNALWIEPPLYFNVIALISVVLEFSGLWVLWKFLKDKISVLELNGFERKLFYWLFFAIAVKIVMQFTASCPYFARLAYTVRDLIIGYLHWVMLAVYSVALLFFGSYLKLFRLHRGAFYFFFWSMFIMVDMILLRGILIWQKISVPGIYNLALVAVTLFMFTGILLIAWYGEKEV
jgi:hypothetical protein